MSRCDEAIAVSEADRAFAILTRFDHVLLAVSGGPDSLALLYLVAEWRKRLGATAPDISVATVDHGLRPESAREAYIVAEHCAALGVPHTTLHWDEPKPAHGIPNAARAARYGLLDAHARTLGGDEKIAVATAHHQDDQAETVVMRLARGGGVDALSAMSPERALHIGSLVRLVRPLLGLSKTQLIATLNARGVAWLDDPTNTNTTFERARVRQVLEPSGLDAAALATTARRMQEARDGLAYAAARFKETLSLSLNGGVFAAFDRTAFDAGPSILRQAILADMIVRFGGATPKPDASEIEALATRLAAGNAASSTLGGAQISVGERTIRVWREAGRLTTAGLALTPGQRTLWDDRFWVACIGDSGTAVSVRTLGRADYEAISGLVPAKLRPPSSAAYGLPGFWADATLLAVPQLGVTTEAGGCRSGLMLVSEPVVL